MMGSRARKAMLEHQDLLDSKDREVPLDIAVTRARWATPEPMDRRDNVVTRVIWA